jgi:hypothetical protein
MNEQERDRLLAELIARPADRANFLLDANLDEGERDALAGLAETADLLWLAGRSAPALADDPVAAMLGLVPTRELSLGSSELSRARKRVGLAVSDVAARLQARGWDFQTRDVFRWETRSASDVPPAVVQALADILDTPIDDLTLSPSSAPATDHFAELRSHPLFAQLVERWANVRHVSPAMAIAALEGRMLATVHRGERPDANQMLRSLDELVTSVEQMSEESN